MKIQLVELRKGNLVDRSSVKGELSEVIEKLKKLYAEYGVILNTKTQCTKKNLAIIAELNNMLNNLKPLSKWQKKQKTTRHRK